MTALSNDYWSAISVAKKCYFIFYRGIIINIISLKDKETDIHTYLVLEELNILNT